MPSFPKIECYQSFPTLQVADIKASLKFYTEQLGFSELFTWGEPVSYAGVGLDKSIIHLAQVKGDRQKSEVNFVIGDADGLYEIHQSKGVRIIVAIDDREYGLRDYGIADLDGNKIGFGHYIYNQGPSIMIERVEIPVRLERRLAEVLEDLAKHKKMTVSETLEETLLHTFERLGDGVASPHTSSTLNYIAELKKKHGIDYDSHAGYRFKER